MSDLSTILVVKAAAVQDVNRTFAAMGWGPNSFSVPLTADNPATENSAISHWMLHQEMSAAETAELQGMQNNALPAIAGKWGEEGVIDAAAAQTACGHANLTVYSASGEVDPQKFKAGIIKGLELFEFPQPAA